MERLIIKKFVLGIMSTNCYLIENNNHSILIDPGDKAELLINYLSKILYLIFDYPHKHYTFKHFEI